LPVFLPAIEAIQQAPRRKAPRNTAAGLPAKGHDEPPVVHGDGLCEAGMRSSLLRALSSLTYAGKGSCVWQPVSLKQVALHRRGTFANPLWGCAHKSRESFPGPRLPWERHGELPGSAPWASLWLSTDNVLSSTLPFGRTLF